MDTAQVPTSMAYVQKVFWEQMFNFLRKQKHYEKLFFRINQFFVMSLRQKVLDKFIQRSWQFQGKHVDLQFSTNVDFISRILDDVIQVDKYYQGKGYYYIFLYIYILSCQYCVFHLKAHTPLQIQQLQCVLSQKYCAQKYSKPKRFKRLVFLPISAFQKNLQIFTKYLTNLEETFTPIPCLERKSVSDTIFLHFITFRTQFGNIVKN
eukprot:TRINITY_DN2135_c0_g2_i2.p2 TRINITY_DN2135_c0_g2~~TRINITY_DN2135_c0_g2_i2.p2  ORF type:complete len:207 (+),score=-13.57 TRINITY_DN2135_c0_g2_i2:757-1377(+)